MRKKQFQKCKGFSWGANVGNFIKPENAYSLFMKNASLEHDGK